MAEATKLTDGLVLEVFLEGDLNCIPLWFQPGESGIKAAKQKVSFKKEDV